MRSISKWADNLPICSCKKQIDIIFSCIFPVIDNKFCHNIVKLVCVYTRLSPCGPTATLTMFWRNTWSIRGQTHEILVSICQLEISCLPAIRLNLRARRENLLLFINWKFQKSFGTYILILYFLIISTLIFDKTCHKWHD